MEPARLIGLDWGTSSLRAYLYGDGGRILQEKSAASGVMHLEPFILPGEPGIARERLFESAFADICGDWLAEYGKDLPVIACGMVGSTVGWRETAYLRTPVGTGALASALTKVSRDSGGSVQIVTGICASGEPGKSFSEILRGEETQVAGVLSKIENSTKSGTLLIGLPGTHSKWVRVQDRQIVSFSTFVTGELYALLTNYSVVAKMQKKSQRMDREAFRLGLQMARARNGEAAGGLLTAIFSTRSKHVLGELKEEEQPGLSFRTAHRRRASRSGENPCAGRANSEGFFADSDCGRSRPLREVRICVRAGRLARSGSHRRSHSCRIVECCAPGGTYGLKHG